MFKKSVIFFCILYFALFNRKTDAVTPEQKDLIRQHFEKLEMVCYAKHPITEDDAQNLRARKLGTGPNVPCFLSCIFKEIGMINSEGMLEKETILNQAKKVFTTDEELQLLSDYLHSCSHINDNPVSDGDKGCERSTMAFECLIKNAASYEFEF